MEPIAPLRMLQMFLGLISLFGEVKCRQTHQKGDAEAAMRYHNQLNNERITSLFRRPADRQKPQGFYIAEAVCLFRL